MSIKATPEKAPSPVPDYLNPSAQERSASFLASSIFMTKTEKKT